MPAGLLIVWSRRAPLVIGLVVAMIVAGCGAGPARPSDSAPFPSRSTPSDADHQVSPSVAETSDSLPTLPELGDVQFSCGSPLTFNAAALQGAPGVETLSHPATIALRDLMRQGGVPNRSGWRVVVVSASSAQFLLPAAPDEGFAYWSAEFGVGAGGWTFVRSGQCDLRPVFQGVEAARWELAPGEAPTADTTTIKALVTEQGCASGRSPDGRVLPAAVVYLADHIAITFATRPLPGAHTCEPGPPAVLLLDLEEPIGDRQLLDASIIPPEPRWP